MPHHTAAPITKYSTRPIRCCLSYRACRRHMLHQSTSSLSVPIKSLNAEPPLHCHAMCSMPIPAPISHISPIHVVLHEPDIIVFGQLAISLQIRPFVCWHALHQIFNQLVGNQRVTEVKLGDIGLWCIC